MKTPREMTIPTILTQRVASALQKAFGEDLPEDFAPHVTVAADLRYGDYQTNAAMLLAKALRNNPRAIAQQVVDALEVADISETPEIAGPGFINFKISADALQERLSGFLDDEKLGVVPVENPETVVIDFSSPNVAKPMHVGHIRSTVIGDCLSRIHRFVGHDVITDNHIGDWGTQFGIILYGFKNFLDQEAFEKDPVGELVRVYRHTNSLEKEDPDLRETFKGELVKLQAGDEENTKIWRECLDKSLEGLKIIYEALGVSFDHYLGESFYNDALGPLVDELLENDVAEVSDGAVCIFFPDNKALAEKPCLIRKSDGGFLYGTTDLATIDYRINEFKADRILYVVGAPQQLHFQQIFEAVKKRGQEVNAVHVAFGSIMGEDGKMMKTRSGENVQLVDVLNEAIERAEETIKEKNSEMGDAERAEVAKVVGVGAVKYAELSQHRMTDYKFIWDKMLAFQGNTAPYLQYSYVRTRAIFRKLGETPDLSAPIEIKEDAERELARLLCRFAEEVPEVLKDYRPNGLASYLYDVASAFHSFFEACPVLRSEGVTKHSRLVLCELTSRVLKTGLGLLGIQVTERM